jgi:CMP-N-acetylneuraminic acid synthetase
MTFKNLKIISIIPARGSSKGIPHKNIRILGGKPLIAYAIDPSLKSKVVQRTIVSTDSRKIADISEKYGAEVIMRPGELAQDDTPDLPVFQHVLNKLDREEDYRPDIIVHLRCTTPFRTAEDIDGAIRKLIGKKADGVRTVNLVTESPYWMDVIEGEDVLRPFIPGGRKYKSRQKLPKVYRTNGIVDVVRRNIITIKNSVYAEENQRAVITPTERSMEIDTELDFIVCESILKRGIWKE